MPRQIPAAGLLALLGLSACGEPPPARAPAHTPDRGADKARLFGDPGLVPTREGERARRELALAGQIRTALLELGEVSSASVDVELAPEPAQVLVVLSTPTDDGDRLARLEQLANRAAATVVDPAAQITVLVDPAPKPVPTGGPALPLPLALALLGLGVSAGIAAERYRGRARR